MKHYYSHQKHDAVKNYFPLPNEIFSLNLSSGEISVYSFLMYCENRKTFQCHPSYKKIGKALHISQNTVKKYVDRLVEKRLITTEPTQVITKNGRKRNGNLLYTILPIEEAVEYYYEQQMMRLDEEMMRQSTTKKLAEYDHKHPKAAV